MTKTNQLLLRWLIVMSGGMHLFDVIAVIDERDGKPIIDNKVAILNGGCEMPISLDKLKLVFVTDPNYAPFNPYSNSLIEMGFSRKSYVFSELQTEKRFIGAYKFKKVAKNVGYLEGKDVIGTHILRYTLTLVCKNAFEGRYIFSQEREGELSDINQNMGVYYILPNVLL
ncbi:hypothetical protein [uncultured Shewanella sp.]|uniref:hypothetical protein n=1 Tax=uncultured Shewanella sp. TaxID=173975 RepID=UPI00260DE98E|nr:hypothetical protein [uncultured Shewanella sp.]